MKSFITICSLLIMSFLSNAQSAVYLDIKDFVITGSPVWINYQSGSSFQMNFDLEVGGVKPSSYITWEYKLGNASWKIGQRIRITKKQKHVIKCKKLDKFPNVGGSTSVSVRIKINSSIAKTFSLPSIFLVKNLIDENLPEISISGDTKSTSTHLNQSVKLQGDISIYPNPSTSTINISFQSYQDGNHNISIRDINGRTFISQDHYLNEGVNNLSLNVKSLNSGLYFINIVDRAGRTTEMKKLQIVN